jgi:hypothetical protein
VSVFVNTFFEKRLEQLLDLASRVEAAFAASGLEYPVVGGLAAYLYIEKAEPDAGRLTKDIDILVRRDDLERIAEAVEPFGLQCRDDMLLQTGATSTRRAVHLIFSGERVRPEYSEGAPEMRACRTIKGIRLVPLSDLVLMKLTSFRLKDEMHLKDLDEAGLITPDVEAGLSAVLRERLASVRARE